MFQPQPDILGGKAFVQQIADPETVASRFIHICGSDALEGTADLLRAFQHFRSLVERAVRRKDQMGTLRDIDVLPVIDAEGRNRIAFFFEDHRIEYHAIADQVGRLFMKDTGGYLVKNDLFSVYIQGMPGIGPPLETGDQVIARRKIVYYLSFSFIAPLEA